MAVARISVFAIQGDLLRLYLLDDPTITVVASRLSEAIDDLKDWLIQSYQENPWMERPTQFEQELRWVEIAIRPEFQRTEPEVSIKTKPGRQAKKSGPSYRSTEALQYRIPVVVGEIQEGMLRVVLPTLQRSFYCEPDRDLKELVQHYAQEVLSGLSARGIVQAGMPGLSAGRSTSVSSSAAGSRRDGSLTTNEAADSTAGTSFKILRFNVKLSALTRKSRQRQTEVLESVASPMGSKLHKAYGRESLWRSIESALRENCSLLLVGDSGVGKTTLLHKAAKELGQGPALEPRVWQSSASRLISGMRYLGEWEERCLEAIRELQAFSGILCIASLRDLISAGGHDAHSSIGAFLVPLLQKGDLQLVIEATPTEWMACRQLLPELAECLQVVRVPNFERAEAINVLDIMLNRSQQRYRFQMASGLAETIYSLCERFMPYAVFPGPAAQLIPSGKSWFQDNGAAKASQRTVSNIDIVRQFSKRTGLPERFLRDDLPLSSSQLRAELESEIIGQPEAISVALDLLSKFKAGLNDPKRPLGVLLLCGPTGVGKTELAKVLAEILFQDRKRLIRLDMSEYAGYGACERLIGSIYSNKPSDLVRQVKAQPMSVVLLDEIEKADPEVFDVLLRMLDEGQLTDPLGTTVSFQSSIVILTSNLGAEQMKRVGLVSRQVGSFKGAASQFFRPEFINRLDAVVSFKALDQAEIQQITLKELRELKSRPGVQRRGILLSFSSELVEELVQRGFDSKMGARLIQRAIEQTVVAPLSEFLTRHPKLEAGTQLKLGWGGSLNIEQA
jgi:ATP-dependent Clp protease ATP-binding subunit ClpC